MFSDLIEIERAKRDVYEPDASLPVLADAPSIASDGDQPATAIAGWLTQLKDKFVPRERQHDEVC